MWLPPESLTNVKHLIQKYDAKHKNADSFNLVFDRGNLK